MDFVEHFVEHFAEHFVEYFVEHFVEYLVDQHCVEQDINEKMKIFVLIWVHLHTQQNEFTEENREYRFGDQVGSRGLGGRKLCRNPRHRSRKSRVFSLL